MLVCKHCGKECKNENSLRNHERTCPSNENRVYKNGMLGKTGRNQYTKAKSVGIDLAHPTKGKPGRQLTDTQKEHLSQIARDRNFGGYNENAGRSKKFHVADSYGNIVCLQSTYELKCSEILNELKVKWIRPSALKYDTRNYFADFYLPDYDLYLDPKNSYKARLDADKLCKVCEQNNVRVVVLLENQLTETFIKNLCS